MLCEVFVRHFTISLATKGDHAMDGYESWRARSSDLEASASTKVIDKLEDMLVAMAGGGVRCPS